MEFSSESVEFSIQDLDSDSSELDSWCTPTEIVFDDSVISDVEPTDENLVIPMSVSEEDIGVEDTDNNNNEEPNRTQVIHEGPMPFSPLPTDKRIQAVKFALTYPRCEVTPGAAMKNLVDRLGEQIKWATVSVEAHQDGFPHLHVAVYFKERLRYTDRTGSYWDFVTGQHGNYQVMRKPHEWLAYVIKHGNYVSYPVGFNPVTFIASKQTKKSAQGEAVAKMMIDGHRDIRPLAEIYPGYFIANLRRVEEFRDMLNETDDSGNVYVDLPPLPALHDLSSKEITVLQWLSSVKSDPQDRSRCHMLLRGGSGIGKSTVAFVLHKYFRIFYMPYNTDFYCDWDDTKYDIVVFDEYKSQKTIQFVNQFSDGFGIALNRKQMRATVHRVKTPCLILTNYTFEEMYPKVLESDPNKLDTIKRRFTEIDFYNDENLFSLIDFLQ